MKNSKNKPGAALLATFMILAGAAVTFAQDYNRIPNGQQVKKLRSEEHTSELQSHA